MREWKFLAESKSRMSGQGQRNKTGQKAHSRLKKMVTMVVVVAVIMAALAMVAMIGF